MTHTTLWWSLAAALVALELVSGTFYLLMLALGAAAGALAAHAGGLLPVQLAAAAGVGGLAAVLWRLWSVRRAPAHAQPLHWDVGSTVQVDAWDAQGRAQVRHRGAVWAAVCAQPLPTPAGLHRIARIEGNTLVLEKA